VRRRNSGNAATLAAKSVKVQFNTWLAWGRHGSTLIKRAQSADRPPLLWPPRTPAASDPSNGSTVKHQFAKTYIPHGYFTLCGFFQGFSVYFTKENLHVHRKYFRLAKAKSLGRFWLPRWGSESAPGKPFMTEE
jgi:hypothetical protein